jgi:hypothetical protein
LYIFVTLALLIGLLKYIPWGARQNELLLPNETDALLSVERVLEIKSELEATELRHDDPYVSYWLKMHSNAFGELKTFVILKKEDDFPSKITKGKRYDIKLYQHASRPALFIKTEGRGASAGEGMPWDYEIITIKHHEQVIFDKSTCELHHCPMRFDRVPVHYGLMQPGTGEYYQALESKFMNGIEYSLGGCVIMPGWSECVTRKFICPECVRALREWEQEQHRKNAGKLPPAHHQ